MKSGLGVDHELAYRYPAIVAGVGALVVVAVILILSGCSGASTS